MEINSKIEYITEKIYEDDEMILWRISWHVFGEHREYWIEEEKEHS